MLGLRALVLTAVALGVGAVPASARTIPVDGNITAKYAPGATGQFSVEGVLAQKGFRARYVVQGKQVGNDWTGKFRVCDRYGSFRGTNDGHVTGTSGSFVQFVDKLTVTGGTGRYQKAKGTLREEGTNNRATSTVEETVKGKLKIRAGAKGTGGRCSVPD